MKRLGLIVIVAAVAWLLLIVLPLAVRSCDTTPPEAPRGLEVGQP